MTSKERVNAVINRKTPDRIPSGFWYHFPENQFFGQAAVDAHLDFLKDTDIDILKIMNENLYTVDSIPASSKDWRNLPSLPLTAPIFERQISAVKGVLDGIDGEVYTLVTVHGVFASAFHALNIPDSTLAHENPLDEWIRDDPESMKEGFMRIADSLVRYCEACIEAGVDGIYYAALGAESYRKYNSDGFNLSIKEGDLAVLNAVEGMSCDLFTHICKDSIRYDLYKDYPGDVFNWAIHENGFSLTDGYQLFNKPILGGFDDRDGVLVNGSPAEIEKAVGEIVKEAQDASIPFILGADCTLPTGLPGQNIRSAVDAVRKINP